MEIDVLEFLPVFLYPNLKCTKIFYCRPENFINVLDRKSDYYVNITVLYKKITDEFLNNSFLYDEMLFALLSEILVLLSRGYCADNDSENINEIYNMENYTIISAIVRYSAENLSTDLAESFISKKFGISKSHFSRLFKLYNKMNYSKYIRRMRVEHAFDLIREKKMKILDSAYESGFGSSSGFYKAVKEIKGIHPSQLKNDSK